MTPPPIHHLIPAPNTDSSSPSWNYRTHVLLTCVSDRWIVRCESSDVADSYLYRLCANFLLLQGEIDGSAVRSFFAVSLNPASDN